MHKNVFNFSPGISVVFTLKKVFIPVLDIAGQNGAVSSHFSQLMFKYDIGKTWQERPT